MDTLELASCFLRARLRRFGVPVGECARVSVDLSPRGSGETFGSIVADGHRELLRLDGWRHLADVLACPTQCAELARIAAGRDVAA